MLIMGPPGAGKGTQAAAIADHYGVPAISTGDIFRSNVDARTSLGEAARRYMDAGEYVPDDVTNAMVRDRLARPDCADGFLLDGYPRTLAQVNALDGILAERDAAVDTVISLDVDREELVRRLLRRAGIEQRVDDTEEVVRRRQEVYAAKTAPLLAEYAARGLLVVVDGTGTAQDVAERAFEALGVTA
jgi:adenylate kinase